jgi:adenosylcobalamin-dependent ribonucleoside-triphosphate reductase
MDYTDVCKRIVDNGEPGFAWLDNMRHYSRMQNGGDNKDRRVAGGNPCLEQSLESYELCCLVETFPSNHDSLEDYQRTLKYAYLYAKTVTLGRTHWPETNRVMLRNRRIGCSVSGVAQFITKNGMEELKNWLESGYDTIQDWDKMYSDWFAVPKSIKTTSVKPSGTVSLLVGATPGMHYPESRFYIRRMRLSKHSELLKPLKKAGYKLEPAFGSEDSTMVVEVPVDVGEGIRTAAELSIWEQFSLAAFLQRHWADNQVSCTATFDPETEADQLPYVLNYFQYRLKGISLLPRHELGAYKQMPYEAIDEKTYNKMVKKLGKLSFVGVEGEEADVDKFCNNDVCEIVPMVDEIPPVGESN